MRIVSIRIERATTAEPVAARHRGRRRVLAAALLAAVATIPAAGIANATTAPAPASSEYTALNPVKLLTSRVMTASASAQLVVAGGTSPVPSTATSVLIKVDVSGGTTTGRLDLYPLGAAEAQASVRWTAGHSETDQITLRVGTSRKILLKNAAGKVTVSVHLLGYYAPQDVPTTYVTSPASSKFLWNSQYVFETSPNSFTEYFTRYDDVSVPVLTQAALQNGALQVFFTPSPANNPSAWVPLPYQFDSSFGFTYNFTYVARAGHVVLMFYFIQTDPSATLPTLSSFALDTYNFKIVVTPHAAGSTAAATPQRPRTGHTTCIPIPDGRSCTVTP